MELLDTPEELQDELNRRGVNATLKQLEDIVDWAPPYDDGDVQEVIQLLKQEGIAPHGKRERGELKAYIKGRAQLRRWIERRESSLWQRRDYQKDLKRLASMPEDRLLDSLKEIIKKYAEKPLSNHVKSPLWLTDEWVGAIRHHLLDGEAGRPAARLMVELALMPRLEITLDEQGGKVETELKVTPEIPMAIIQEHKKFQKKLRSIEADTKRGRLA